jgi:hypothetical protein
VTDGIAWNYSLELRRRGPVEKIELICRRKDKRLMDKFDKRYPEVSIIGEEG